MNIKWVNSRSSKKDKKNTSQAYLRWYEAGKEKSKILKGMVKFTGRLTPQQRTHNHNIEIDITDILNQNKKELSIGLFDIEKWEKKGKSFVEYAEEYIKNLRSQGVLNRLMIIRPK